MIPIKTRPVIELVCRAEAERFTLGETYRLVRCTCSNPSHWGLVKEDPACVEDAVGVMQVVGIDYNKGLIYVE